MFAIQGKILFYYMSPDLFYTLNIIQFICERKLNQQL